MSAIATNCQCVGAASITTGNGIGQQSHQLVLVITCIMECQRTHWATAVEMWRNGIERNTSHFTSMLPVRHIDEWKITYIMTPNLYHDPCSKTIWTILYRVHQKYQMISAFLLTTAENMQLSHLVNSQTSDVLIFLKLSALLYLAVWLWLNTSTICYVHVHKQFMIWH